MLALSLGTVDVAYMFFEWTLANKAAYVGARTAIVSNPVASNLKDLTYTATELQQPFGNPCYDMTTGNATSPANCPTPSSNFVCVSGSCGAGNTYDSAAFTHILTAMQNVFPRITASNIEITYSPNNLGFAGQPWAGSNFRDNNIKYTLPTDVTVCIGCSATPMTHQFFFIQGLLRFFGGAFPATKNIPRFSTTLPSESLYTMP
jgi:hypothetical protein